MGKWKCEECGTTSNYTSNKCWKCGNELATPTPMNDTQPTGLDLDTIFRIIDEKYVPEKISSGVELYSGSTDAPSFRHGFNLAKKMVIEEAKQALTRWGLEQRVDEWQQLRVIDWCNCKAPDVRRQRDERIAELQANLQDGGE